MKQLRFPTPQRRIRKSFFFSLRILFIFGLFLVSTPHSLFADDDNPPGFMDTLNKLTLTPQQRELALSQKRWAKELGVGATQAEADALIKLLEEPGRIKFACMAPMGTTWAKYIREIPKIFIQRAGDIMHMDAYIGLSLGNDPDYVRKMAAGSLESAGMTSWGMKYISKEMSVYELPFLFDTYGEADYVMKKTWPYFVEKFKEKGFVLVPTSFEVGFLQMFSTNTIIKTPDDLKGTKYASWMEDVEVATLKHFNVNPVVITVMEIPSSLATGVIQTASSPTMYMIGAQLMSFIGKGGGCSGINMFYPPGGLVYIKKNIINSTLTNVPKGEREYLMKYMDKALILFDDLLQEMAPKLAAELREGNKKLLADLQKKGMNLYIPTKEEREKWKQSTRPIWDNLAGKAYSKEILDDILKAKAEYRAAHPEEFENYVWVP